MSNNSGWVGVDLDGTLAEYDTWQGPESIGMPIPLMVKYVQELLYLGVEVRIFTARVQEGARAIRAIEEWCVKYIGQVLPVTNKKDMGMVFLIDDRAVAVKVNTGIFLNQPPKLRIIQDHWAGAKAPGKEFKRD